MHITDLAVGQSTLAADQPHLVALSGFWRAHRNALIDVPIKIAVVIVVAIIVRVVIHRMIDRAVRPNRGKGPPRILQPFTERLQNSALLESAGLLSERRKQRAATLGSVLKSAASITIFVIAFMLVLSELSVNLGPFIAGTSIIGVAIGFGAQNLVRDFLSGMFMLMEDQYGVGDVIDFEMATGTVEGVGLRSTRLRDVNGTVWYVRNGEVVRVGNMSQGFAAVVLDIPVDVGADVTTASAEIGRVAQEMAAEEAWATVFMSQPEVQGVQDMTRFQTVIRLVARTRPLEQWRTARELRGRIRHRLDELNMAAGQPTQVDPESVPPLPAADQ